MKYLLFDHGGVDIFMPTVTHSDRAISLSREIGPVKVVSAGKVQYTELGLDPFIVTHGSHSLGIVEDKAQAVRDEATIRQALIVF